MIFGGEKKEKERKREVKRKEDKEEIRCTDKKSKGNGRIEKRKG